MDNIDRFKDKIQKIGFSDTQIGATVLPSIVGPVTGYNAEGKNIIHKDRPMETAYRQAEWHWTEWRGRYDTEEMSKIVDIPYKRYPRTFIFPPGVELTITENKLGEKIIITPIYTYNSQDEEFIVHVVNLILEIFGECKTFDEKFESLFKMPIKKLNWRILPSGEYPWKRLEKDLEPLIKQSERGNAGVTENRLKIINSYKPSLYAVGEAGFSGYIVMGFTERNLYLLESIYYGNATYIFEKDWRNLSKMTKAEILNKNLQKDRIIHREGWGEKIEKLLN
ncbi:MAG: hypothetical protein PHR36_03905 [Patescibacteria group bacterium]|nr:hypothetical protein [Patescibacteria group bacterium]